MSFEASPHTAGSLEGGFAALSGGDEVADGAAEETKGVVREAHLSALAEALSL